uniref:Uncharacterized protein AlNc14C398G11345 n=1 Tax=Albugo laibachii Nc14 TaxID=890382 RepID=F0WYT5_9STRA|nr:conserved hypothetical protein [Albugo laibachii Nc14]|eukprot:CCA26644.1 conserved hypothetical protein [Albugo laibachii Nc14]
MQNRSLRTPIVSRTEDKQITLSSSSGNLYTFPRLRKKYILTRRLNVRVHTTRNDVAPVYLLQDGFFVCRNLLPKENWIQDHERTHCTVCMQHFLPFRRRHHCRTCGEVVCNACSYRHRIHITDLNIGFVTRLCAFCIIHATNASIQATKPKFYSSENQVDEEAISRPSPVRVPSKSTESVMTDGSVVQLWPLPGQQSLATFHTRRSIISNKHDLRSRAQSAVDNHGKRTDQNNLTRTPSLTDIQHELLLTSNVSNPLTQSQRLAMIHTKMLLKPNHDPTMELLLSIVAKTVACPAAIIGSVDEKYLWIHASIGLDTSSKVPREDFVCTHHLRKAESVWIVQDATWDKHFHAATIMIKGAAIRFYAGTALTVNAQRIGVVSVMDNQPRKEISNAMKSTLEAVGKIASEVLEQRLKSICTQKDNVRNSSLDGALDSVVPLSLDCNDAKVGSGHSSCMTEFFNLSSDMQDAIHECMQFMNEALRPQPKLEWKQCRDVEDGISASYEGVIRTDRHTQIKLFRSSFHVLVGSDIFHPIEMIPKCMDPRLTLSSKDWLGHFFKAEGYMSAILEDRQYFSPYTWMDHFILKQEIDSEEEKCCILTHKREYTDGSAMIVTLVYDEDARESPILMFLFGWLLTCHQKKNNVNATCLVAQQCPQSQALDEKYVNLSTDWCLDLLQIYKNEKLQLSKVSTESRLSQRPSECNRESDIEEVIFTRTCQREWDTNEKKRQLVRTSEI